MTQRFSFIESCCTVRPRILTARLRGLDLRIRRRGLGLRAEPDRATRRVKHHAPDESSDPAGLRHRSRRLREGINNGQRHTSIFLVLDRPRGD